MLSFSPEFKALSMTSSIILAVVGIALIAVLDRVADPYKKDSRLADRTAFVLATLFIFFIVNLTLPVHYNYVGTSQVDNSQIVNVTKSKENTDNVDLQATYYKLKNGKTYKVYNKDVTRKQAHVKHTVYKFKRSQAKISPIRRLFSTKPVPERVYLTVTEPVK